MDKPYPNNRKKGGFATTPDSTGYAGLHLFVDMWGAHNTADQVRIEKAVYRAVSESNAVLKKFALSDFGDKAGITAFAILAESHICVNTWFEERVVAIDIFFCAGLNPYLCIPALKSAFQPEHIKITEHKRLLSNITNQPLELDF